MVLIAAVPAQLVIGPLGAAGTPAKVFGMGLLLWWLFDRVSDPDPAPRGSRPLRLALGAFAASIALSYLAAMSRPIEAIEMRGADRSLLSVLALCGMALVADRVLTRERLQRLLKFVAGAGAVLATIGIVQFFGWDPIATLRYPGLVVNAQLGLETRSIFPRVQATALHAIEFGVVLNMIIPLTLHFSFTATTARAKRIWWLAVAVTATAIPMTVARSAMVGAAVVALVLLPSWPKSRRRAAYIVLPFAALALKVVVPGLLGTIRGLFVDIESDPSTQGRTADYAAVGHFIAESPFFGRGMDTFLPSTYRTLDNQYLLTLVSTGIVGLVALIGLIVTGVVLVSAVRRRSLDPLERDLALSLKASLLVPLFTFATFDGLSFPFCTSLMFVLLGCAGALYRLSTEQQDSRPMSRVSGPKLSQRTLLAVGASAGVVVMLGAAVVSSAVRPEVQYIATGAVLLSPTNYKGNPYSYGLDVNVVSETVVDVLTTDPVRERIQRGAEDAEYSVAIGLGSLKPETDRDGLGPVLKYQASSADLDDAAVTRQRVREQIDVALDSLQTQVQAPRSSFIVATDVIAWNDPSPLTGPRSRAVAMKALLAGTFWWLVAVQFAKVARARNWPTAGTRERRRGATANVPA